MALKSYAVRGRLKRARGSLRAILAFTSPNKDLKTFQNLVSEVDQVHNKESTVAHEPAPVIRRSNVSQLIEVPEPYLTWLSYTRETPPSETSPAIDYELQKGDKLPPDAVENEVEWPFINFPLPEARSERRKRDPPPNPSFHPFMRLPYELRMKIYRLTISPRIAHYNGYGAHVSKIKLQRHIPRMLHICAESRAEAFRIYRLSPALTQINPPWGSTATLLTYRGLTTYPLHFAGAHDTLLWTRYGSAPTTFDRDAARLLDPLVLQNVRIFAVLIDFWNRVLSDPKFHEGYEAVRRAPQLEMLVLVQEEGGTERWRKRRTYGKRVVVEVWKGGGEAKKKDQTSRKMVRWEKEVRGKGAEVVWREWDGKILGRDNGRGERFPEIGFGKIVLMNRNARKGVPDVKWL